MIGAFALTQNLFLIAIGLGIGAIYVRSMTIMLVERKTLAEFRYLEHGAFWSILVLSVIMFLQTIWHVSELITGMLGAGFILLAFISSVLYRRAERGPEMGLTAAERVVAVTGCSSGIGEAITMDLLDLGWQVIGISRRRPAFEADRFRHVAADLSDPKEADRAFARIGPVDAAIHAAGLLRVGPHQSMNLDDGALMWRLHVDVAARMIQALAPQMPDGGRIVLIGSRVAAGAPGRSLYAASKSALTGLARSCAAELAPRGITVNIVAPGATDTPMLRDPGRAGVAPKLPPMGRFVAPGEVSALATYLLSPQAASITGQQIVICAGASL